MDSNNSYFHWRASCARPEPLHEGEEVIPSERLLQAVWFHQRIRRDALRTVGGESVRVLHPGFWNREAGPDFKNAIIQIGDHPPKQGDLEIDLHSRGWRSHGHEGNPRYSKVILHVVWESHPEPSAPTLELRHFLEAPLSRLIRWHGAGGGAGWPIELSGQCRIPLRQLAKEEQEQLLHDAAEARFDHRVQRLELRAEQTSPWQSLLEFMSRGLGYKQNVWPMQHMGELLPLLHKPGEPVDHLVAKLLGVAGLLPPETKEPSHAYQHQLEETWLAVAADLKHLMLPRSVWQLHHLRPANQPHRRLALAAHWATDPTLQRRLESWAMTATLPRAKLIVSLSEAFGSPYHPFWSHHWTLQSPRWSEPQPMLGRSRLSDLAMNTLLPWLWWRMGQLGRRDLQVEMRRRYQDWPSCQDNAVLKLARERLLGGNASCLKFRRAAAQQGLHQIVGDFCEHSNSLCDDCPLPKLIDSSYG